ncbi:MAG: hypothetical protein AC479_00710 [miscellaneous Crenarchaeota group-6 archaeon AD8-1]|nr:MAG: hypothetical protein AC479_00710 [miscellaneous Crenarchaeota group-6 archaeon AD8-1]
MSLILGLEPSEIEEKEKREKFTISIIGCRKAGIQFAVAFADAGFRVICNDDDQNLLQLLIKGKTPYFTREIESKIKSNIKRGRIRTESDIKTAVSQSQIVILTTFIKINIRNKLNFSKIERNCKKIGKVLNRGMLIIYANISGIGYIEKTIKSILEDTSGFRASEDFGLVYCPIQLNDKNPNIFTEKDLMIAGTDKESLNAAEIVLKTIMKKEIKKITDFKILEAAILFAIANNDLKLAFANEMAIFSEKLGLDYFEIIKIIEEKNTFFSQNIGIEEGEKSKFYMLLESADNNAANAKLCILARKINEGLGRYLIKLTQQSLRTCGKTLRRTKISIIGSFQPRSTVSELIKLIEKKGAKINFYDPFLPKIYLQDYQKLFKRTFNEAVEGVDCLIILHHHPKIKRINFKKLSARMKMPAAIIDFSGILEPKKAEKAGFIFSGLGREAKK